MEHSESIEFVKEVGSRVVELGWKKRRGIGKSELIARANRTDVIVTGHDEEKMSVVSGRRLIKTQS